MVNLVLAILCSSLITVLMRVSEKYRKNDLSMLAMNYLMCSVFGWMFTGSSLTMSAEATAGAVTTAVAMGVVTGVLYLAGFMLLQWNITKNGVVLPSTFMKLGVLVPTILAIAVFGEAPKATQLLGIAAAVCAIFMIQGGGKQEIGSVAGLVVLLVVGGVADSMVKIYEEVGDVALKNHYLLCTFGVSLALCAALCVVKKQKLTAADALFGLAIGVPNYFSSWFLLRSLASVPAVVAYPTFSVGTIILVAAAGMLLFREKISKRKAAALGVILVSLALLNL